MRGLVVGLVLLAGCGGPEWAGRYVGAAEVTASCSDGSSVTNHTPESLSIAQTGDTLSFAVACGVIAQAKISGSSATLVPFDCPQTTDENGNIINKSYQFGGLKLDGDKLTTNLTSTTNARGANGAHASCSAVETGNLTLVP